MRSMKFIVGFLLSVIPFFAAIPARCADFGVAENALGEFSGTRYENVYTKVPTTGKLVSIKITDNGRIYYICREKTGYAIYHLEFRPIPGYKEKLEQELKDAGRKWDRTHPDELLFTKERYDTELRRKLSKYSEAVWVRNEIVVDQPQQPRATGQ
jgi:hypothetical protein